MHAMQQFDVAKFILTTTATDRELGHTFHLSKNTIRRYRDLLNQRGVAWAEIEREGPAFVEDILHAGRSSGRHKHTPDLAALDQALRAPAQTLQLWWEGYRKADPRHALSYSHLAAKLAAYRAALPAEMRQGYKPGEQVAVDYSGMLASYMDEATGQPVSVQVFVGVLPHSSLIFCTCTPTQRVPDFLSAHVQMFNYFQGTPAMVVCDNLKSAVLKAGREPVFQRSYLSLAQHYMMLIRNTRPRRPRDKAPAESAVRIVQQRILAVLSQESFGSLDDLNARMRVLLDGLNHRTMKKYGQSRRERFLQTEAAALRSLPAEPYVYAEWTTVPRVPRDYHIPLLGRFYSVPHRLIGQRVDAKVHDGEVQVFHQRICVATHRLSSDLGGHTTDPDHQTEAHRSYAGRSPEGLRAWAESAGPHIKKFVEAQLARTQPYLGMPACEGAQRLAAKHGTAFVDRMCAEAAAMQSMKITTLQRLVARAAKERLAALPATRTSGHSRSNGGTARGRAHGTRAASRPAHVRGSAAIVGVPHAG